LQPWRGRLIFMVPLAHPAPEGGVYVSLFTSDPSIVTINPTLLLIRAGDTTPLRQAQVTGVNFGAASVTASAPGLSGDVQTVRVSTTLFGADATTLQRGTTQNISFTLSAPSPSNLVVSLVSDNPSAAAVPASAVIPAGGMSVTVPVSGTGTGSTVIHIGNPFVSLTEAWI
jgi:hypothetical protein